ncbi:hypothetical protein NMG60_11033478 [Bertholletia excelsa]
MSTSLPQGYRFDPTEQEIIHYLRMKDTNKQLPSELPFIEQNLYATEPSHLFRSLPPEQKVVFCFTELKKRSSKRIQRTVRIDGNTVGTGKDQKTHRIPDTDGHSLIGIKKLLTFQSNNPSKAFSMREYHLAGKDSKVGTYTSLNYYFIFNLLTSITIL